VKKSGEIRRQKRGEWMGRKKLTNEALTAALLERGTVRDAAEALGVAESTVYSKMKDADFSAQYERTKGDLLRGCVNRLSSQIGGAVDVIASIMNDASVNPAVRIQAARMILDYNGRYNDRLTASDSDLVNVVGGIVVKMKRVAEEDEEDDPLSAALRAEARRLMEENPPEN